MKFAPCVLLALLAFQSCLFVDGSFHEKTIDGVVLSPQDNPGLRKRHTAVVDPRTARIELKVPDYVDSRTLVPTVEFRGLSVAIDGQSWAPGAAVDLSRDRRLTVTGLDDGTRDYVLAVATVAPDSSKEVVSLRVYIEGYSVGSSGYVLLSFQQEAADRWFLKQFALDQVVLYLEAVTTGISVWHGGERLYHGWFPSDPLSLRNRLPFQDTTLTIVAEDLSTRDVALVFGTAE